MAKINLIALAAFLVMNAAYSQELTYEQARDKAFAEARAKVLAAEEAKKSQVVSEPAKADPKPDPELERLRAEIEVLKAQAEAYKAQTEASRSSEARAQQQQESDQRSQRLQNFLMLQRATRPYQIPIPQPLPIPQQHNYNCYTQGAYTNCTGQ